MKKAKLAGKMQVSVQNYITNVLADGFLHSFEDLFNIANDNCTLDLEEFVFVHDTLLEAEKALNHGEHEAAFSKYEELGRYFHQKNFLKWAAHFFEKCRLLGESKVRKVRLLRIAYHELGLVYEQLQKYDESIDHRKMYVRCWEKNGKDIELMDAFKELYTSYRLKGHELFKQGLHEKSLANFYSAMEAARGARDVSLEAEIYFDIGELYANQDKTDDSIEAYRKYLKIANESENKKAERRAYYVLGNAYRKQRDIILAYNYFKKFLELVGEESDIVEKCLAERMMGEIFTEMNDYEKALIHSQKNYELCIQQKDLKSLNNARVYLGVTEGRVAFTNTLNHREE